MRDFPAQSSERTAGPSKGGADVVLSGQQACQEFLNESSGYRFVGQHRLRSLAETLDTAAEDTVAAVIGPRDKSRSEPQSLTACVANAVGEAWADRSAPVEWDELLSSIATHTAMSWLGLARASSALITLMRWAGDPSSPEFETSSEEFQHQLQVSLSEALGGVSLSNLDYVVELHWAIRSELIRFVQPLMTRTRTRSKIHQAASVRDVGFLTKFMDGLDRDGAIASSPALRCVVLETMTVSGRSQLQPGDRVRLQAETLTLRLPWLGLVGLTDGDVQARDLMLSTVAAVVIEMFCKYRVRSCDRTRLEVVALPSDPSAYHFELLASSPPWSIGEEQAWLLDAHGIVDHRQQNVISIPNSILMPLWQRTRFYNQELFYVAIDRKHDLVFGCPYGGGSVGRSALEMVRQVQCIGSHLTGVASGVDHRVEDSSELARVIESYDVIRKVYFTWAYFAAFLAFRLDWVYRVLLLFKKREKFVPLSIVGDLLLVVLLFCIVYAQKVPFLGSRLRGWFQRVVRSNSKDLHAAIAVLDEVLADGRQYILGNEFTAMDVLVCATLGDVIIPGEFQCGAIFPDLSTYPSGYAEEVAELRTTKTGRYVLRTYTKHRLAFGSGAEPD